VTLLSFQSAPKSVRRQSTAGGGRVTAAVVAFFAAAIAPAIAPAADAPATREVVLVVVGADGSPDDLAGRLQDILTSPPLPEDRRVRIARSDFVPSDLFDLSRLDANQPLAWVVLDGPMVHIRVAGAGRAQFVFRDITISRPMTELDRERVGQTLRAAIAVVIEGRPGGLGRAEAQQAIDREQPHPPAEPPRPAAATAPVVSSPVLSRRERAVQFHLGAFFQIARLADEFAYAPGAIGSLEWTRNVYRPDVWLLVMDFVPESLGPMPVAYGLSFRAGVGATIPRLPWLHVDAGAGYDRIRVGGFPTAGSTPVYRVGVRVGPTDRLGICSSLTLSLEHVDTTLLDQQPLGGTTGSSHWRPALTLELWWL